MLVGYASHVWSLVRPANAQWLVGPESGWAMTIADSRAQHVDAVPEAMDVPLHAPAFVGRARELAAITSALEDVQALVLIEGEAGIGKSRVLEQVLVQDVVRDRHVLLAVCPPVREPFPLGPVVDALRGTLRTVTDLRLSPLAGALRPLFPEWAADLPPAPEPMDDREAVRHRLLAALLELIGLLGVDVLVLEDAHWADSSTLELLMMLRATSAGGVSMILTYRPEDVAEDSLLRRLTSLRARGATELRVELTPLTTDESGELVASMFRAERVSREFAEFLRDATEGLPLALEESVRLLRDRHDIVHKDGNWARVTMDDLRVPPTVRDSVLERVARLAPDAQRLLEAAAAVGKPLEPDLLTDIAGIGEAHARPCLAAAMASRLLVEVSPGRVGFRHALAAKAVYEAVPMPERRHLHRAAGQALERLDPQPVFELARHFRVARDIYSWSRYGEAAAKLALESGDDQTATSILLGLLAEAGHPAGRQGSLARALGDAAVGGRSLLGETDDRVIDVLRTTLARADLAPAARGEIQFLLGRFLLQKGRLSDGCAELECSLPDLEHHPVFAARAMLLLARVSLVTHSVRQRKELIHRSDAVVARVSAESDRIPLKLDRSLALLELGERVGWQVVEVLPAAPKTWSTRLDVARGYDNLAFHAVIWGKYREATSFLGIAVTLIDSDDNSRERPLNSINRAHLDYHTGNWAALAPTITSLENFPAVSSVIRSEATVLRGLLALAGGDIQAAEETLSSVLGSSSDPAIDYDALTSTAALARLRLVRGEKEEAAAISQPPVETVRRTGVWLGAIDILPAHVEALVGIGSIDRARCLVCEFAGWLEGRDVPAAEVALEACRARLSAGSGDIRIGAEQFARAAEMWAALPCPYEELLARERQGRYLLEIGERERAVAVLTDARRRLTELGARWDADRIALLLRRHGVEVPRAWRGGRRGYGDQLSPRELEVARLVADGMTNREVGEVLFISPRTVDRHLAGAMRKLGVHSRTALAKVAATDGLPDGDCDATTT